MHQTRKPLEELAIDLLFESFGEHRYNRTPQEYEHLCSLIPPLKQAHHLVNQMLKKHQEAGKFQERAICDFKAGDRVPIYRRYPETISIQTIRSALNNLGFRDPKWGKKKQAK